MAQAEAMETAKEVLRQIIKYRFWICVGVAALFATIAYTIGSGPIREQAVKATSDIKSAEKEVRTYSQPGIPTKEYKPIVEEKTKAVSSDVNTAWRTLYDRQASLLTWPDGVERFQSWGPKWPEKVSPKQVELAIVDYIQAYPAYVNMVYKTFDPFNYETGEGIVAAPPEGVLLAPVQFDEEHLPDLGKVWAAQERLWIQRTVLEGIAGVNKNAKKWNEAVVRQIVSLEVGSPDAQDQRSLAKNQTLEESKGIYAPGEEPKADESGGSGGGGGGGGKLGGMGMPSGGRRGGGGDFMGMGGGATAAPETIFYVKSDSDKYKVLPFAVTVLIDQDRVQDFLVELENSPMSIQVKDFELLRPVARVVKPEKGDAASSSAFGGMMGMMGTMPGGGRMGSGGGMVGMGGMAAQMQQMMMGSQRSRGGGNAGMGGVGAGGTGAAQKSGKSVRGTNKEEERAALEKKNIEAKGPTLFDIYFDIVQVKVYGQARFYNAPPADAVGEPSTSQSAAGAAAEDAKDDKTAAKDDKTAAKDAAATAPEKADATKGAAAVAPDTKDTDAAAKAGAPESDAAAPKALAPAEKPKSASGAGEAPKAAAPDAKSGAAPSKGAAAKP